MTYLLGYDLGTSSVKATLLNAETGEAVASATYPKEEMPIESPQPGWAEQDPEIWWKNLQQATKELLHESKADKEAIKAIGISYQMHGLVLVDKNQKVLRSSIIWSDSRAVEIGNTAFEELGEEYCLKNYLNSPGNFTASKLKWVKENEPETYSKIHKVMLPGDFAAMKLTGEIRTSLTGLSEGIFWNFDKKGLAKDLLDFYGISSDFLPEAVPSFSDQGNLTKEAAEALGLSTSTKVTYRAGDQPNNALSLNVLNPGEIAATAGTSGVIYGVFDKAVYDPKSRVNTFIHVNNDEDLERSGVLLCVNGTGILNSWLRREVTKLPYAEMNDLASRSEIGAKGLHFYPFGNGAERVLQNKELGAQLQNLDFNRHSINDVVRSAQEGIVFALYYGLEIMQEMGMETSTIRAGYANMFLSPVFAGAFASITNTPLELYNTDGSQGAARGAGIGAGIFDEKNAFNGLKKIKEILPEKEKTEQHRSAYAEWLKGLKKQLS